MHHMSNKIEVGIDEAGRGPLLGRVYVGAVILPPDDKYFDHSLMRDSKKLSVRKRLAAYDYIRENAVEWTFAYADEKQIDHENILQATFTTMHRAIDQLQQTGTFVGGRRQRICSRDGKIILICVEEGDTPFGHCAASITPKWSTEYRKIRWWNPHLEVYGLRKIKDMARSTYAGH